MRKVYYPFTTTQSCRYIFSDHVKRSMLLVFCRRQHLVQNITFHLHFGQNWPILQRNLSAISELLVKAAFPTVVYNPMTYFDEYYTTHKIVCWLLAWTNSHVLRIGIYTVNHKKRDILFLTITLANLNRFLQFLYGFNLEEILHATIVKFITSPDLCAHLTWRNQKLHFCCGS